LGDEKPDCCWPPPPVPAATAAAAAADAEGEMESLASPTVPVPAGFAMELVVGGGGVDEDKSMASLAWRLAEGAGEQSMGNVVVVKVGGGGDSRPAAASQNRVSEEMSPVDPSSAALSPSLSSSLSFFGVCVFLRCLVFVFLRRRHEIGRSR
jgi:hypothetical protein